MLDQETKRRIDTARDILVGKLPNPQAQVEQITIAMIYKFMDDMDKEAVEFGGEPTFFTGEYDKYSWTKIFDPRLGGFDMLALYSEAIIKLNQNPNIPQLFRDIFKNAFLPYRDPETLKLFLKTINEFQYDHSEKLGDAFEYLLSVLGSQGDAGQFRTPRHIIDFMVDIMQPQKDETVCDPACGTAGFLISAFKYILNENTKRIKGDLLTPDDRKKLTNNITGYDISAEMVRLSLVNMYLHGFATPHIYEYDTLTSEDRWGDYFDIILANPPFMTPKGGIRPHKKFAMQANRSEVLFLDYIMEHVNPTTGRAAVIVPEGIIFQSATAYKELRKLLIEKNYLYGVVSLPAGIFQPYSGVKTSILLIDKALSKKTKNILFVKIDNDGYSLSSQRKEIKLNNLPDSTNFIKHYVNGIKNDNLSLIDSSNLSQNFLIVEKSQISNGNEYNLTFEKYKVDIGKKNTKFDIVSLSDVSTINPESEAPEDTFRDNEFIYLDISSVENGTGRFSLNNVIVGFNAPSRARRKVKNGDVLLSTVRPNLKGYVFLENIPKNVIASTGFAVLRFNELVSAKFVYHLLFTEHLQNQMSAKMGKGAYPSINQTDIANLQIPFPPLTIQAEIVEKIEQFERIITGAKQVFSSYSPVIDIHPSWENEKVGNIIKLSSGKGLTQQNMTAGQYPVYGGNGIIGYHNESFVNNPIIVIGRVGAYCGSIHITEPNSWITDNGLYVTEYLKPINQDYLALMLTQLNLNKFAKVGGQPSISQNTVYEKAIPLPDLDTQDELVKKIKNEIKLVEHNKELIEIFENKIIFEMNKLWEN